MTIILPEEANKKKKRVRTGKQVKASRSQEVKYRRDMSAMLKLQRNAAGILLKSITLGATKQEAALQLSAAMSLSRQQFDASAGTIATTMVDGVNAEHKLKTEKMIADSLGVDWARVLDDPEIAGEIALRQTKNVELINTIGTDYWGDISQAVEDNYAGTLDKPLISEIARIGGVSERQAKLIARDQTAKFATSLNEVRQAKNGISKYIWSTRKDERVVGNPSGLYPKGNNKHGNHFERDGKIFEWANPPSDGPPGQPINCRCVALPLLDLDELEAQFV